MQQKLSIQLFQASLIKMPLKEIAVILLVPGILV